MSDARRHLSRNVIELLAPARDAECARAAIDHGADAIYIGAPQFGARKAAANSLSDIKEIVAYAHTFGVRVHVALNTVLFDREVAEARRLAWDLYHAGVDVLIVQDAALLDAASMPPIEIHASTQCDNRSVDKVLFWQKIGIRQVVLARELSIDEVAAIARQTTVRLEAFIHGALCVSYSGQCYMSYAHGGRSANRGECAQPCRLPYDVLSKDGQLLMRHAYPLCLKDNNQSANIEALIDAGVSSFKIEGRLKDAGYVANVTLHYWQIINQILERRPDLQPLSRGTVVAGFVPDPAKSFNRGFTDYFAHGRKSDIWQPLSPKSIGEFVGKVSAVRPPDGLSISTKVVLSNGDGLCFVSGQSSSLSGTKVNTVRQGAKNTDVSVQSIKGIKVGDSVFRNSDVAFDKTLKSDKTRRFVSVNLNVFFSEGNLVVSIEDDDGVTSTTMRQIAHTPARDPAASREQIIRAVCKTGGTVFTVGVVTVDDSASSLFFAASELNAIRRDALEAHAQSRQAFFASCDVVRQPAGDAVWPFPEIIRSSNVINAEARKFYESHGASFSDWGYERHDDGCKGQRLMTTRHCIMNALGKCLRKHPECAKLTPLTLRGDDGRMFTAVMNCKDCQMEIS